MFIYYPYALLWGLLWSAAVLIGCVLSNRRLVLAGMIFSSVVASPITSFTAGTSGALYASDLVALVLIACWIFPNTKKMMFDEVPSWYHSFLKYMLVAIISIIFIAPFFSSGVAELGLGQRVHSPIPFIPLPFLMGGFRILRIFMYLVFFSYAVRLVQDESMLRFTYKCIVLAVLGLAICQIITFTGVRDMGWYLPGIEYQEAHILGHSKSAAGRLYVMGIFVSLILLRRLLVSSIYFVILGVIIIGLLFGGSRASFLGVVAGLFIFSVKGKFAGKFVGILSIGLLVLGFYLMSSLSYEQIQSFKVITDAPSTNLRWVIWKWIVVYLAKHVYILATGVGFANFRYALAAEEVAEHAHNDYLTCLTEIGIVGLIFFVKYIYGTVRDINERIKTQNKEMRWEGLCLLATMAAFLISSMFEPSLYYSVGAMCMQRIFAVLFGASTAYWHQHKYYENYYDETEYGELLEYNEKLT